MVIMVSDHMYGVGELVMVTRTYQSDNFCSLLFSLELWPLKMMLTSLSMLGNSGAWPPAPEAVGLDPAEKVAEGALGTVNHGRSSS